MIIETGEGANAIILNSDKVLTVRMHMAGMSDVTFTNGQLKELPVTEADFAHVASFHRFPLPGGGTVLVNLDHLMYATPTWAADQMQLRLDSPAEHGNRDSGIDAPIVKITASELSDILRREERVALGL